MVDWPNTRNTEMRRDRAQSHGAPAVSRVVIGASTGAVPVIESMIAQLSRPGPPIIIAQHMPYHFLTRLTDRLQAVSALPVERVTGDSALQPSTIYLAGGGDVHLVLAMKGEQPVLRSMPGSEADLNCPSIGRLFRSVLDLPDPENTLAVLLSGMGHDGALAMVGLREAGAETWIEDPQTAVVPSLPKSAIAFGAAPRIFTGTIIGQALATRLRADRMEAI